MMSERLGEIERRGRLGERSRYWERGIDRERER